MNIKINFRSDKCVKLSLETEIGTLYGLTYFPVQDSFLFPPQLGRDGKPSKSEKGFVYSAYRLNGKILSEIRQYINSEPVAVQTEPKKLTESVVL